MRRQTTTSTPCWPPEKRRTTRRELVGGERSCWACIPSRTLPLPGKAVHGANDAAATAQVDIEAALAWRDDMAGDACEADQERWLAEHGIALLRGRGRLPGPGVVDIDGVRCTAGHVVVVTGSEPIIAPVPGPWGLEGIPTTSACALCVSTPMLARQHRSESGRGFSLKGKYGGHHR